MPKLLCISSAGANRRVFLRPNLSLLPAPAGNLRPQPKPLGLYRPRRWRNSLVAGRRSLLREARRARMGNAVALELSGFQRGSAARFNLHRRSEVEASGFDRLSI